MLIDLDLGKHCIKTEIKRQYNQLISKYFQTKDPDLEERIEFLKQVLENVDLIGLRGSFPELAGGCDADVQVFLETDGLFRLQINGQTAREQYLPQEND